MLREEQATDIASAQARQDFTLGPVIHANNEDQCWLVKLRLYHKHEHNALDDRSGVYFSNQSWIATLFDSVPGRMKRFRRAVLA